MNGVRVRGVRWCTPMKLSCRELNVDVGTTAIDLPRLIEQKILLKKPATGSASIRFTARDWDNFLVHPQMTQCVADRRRVAPAPELAFSGGGTQLVASGGIVSFPVRFDGAQLTAQLSQRADGSVLCTTDAEGADAAGAWLAGLFETLVLDLDGCALTFKALRVERGAAEPELLLSLDVCVRSFPSLDINF